MTLEEENFYHRQLILDDIGITGQAALKAARVLVVGAGGLGCPSLLYLATLGIGTLGIADFDTVSLSNLHRQPLYTGDDVGKPKTQAATRTLNRLNPLIHIVPHLVRVQQENVLQLIAGYDVVIDGTDNFLVRYLLSDACVFAGKPLVYGSVYHTEANVTVFNYKGSGSLRDLFPEENANYAIPNCAEAGAYNLLTGITGLMMGNEIAKIVLQKGEVAAGILLLYDAFRNSIKRISYSPQPANRNTSLERFAKKEHPKELTVTVLAEKLSQTLPPVLLDVREDWERDIVQLGGLHIPLAQLPERLTELPVAAELVVYCHHGIRSLNAVQFLRKQGFLNTVSLQGGIHAWASQIDPELPVY